MNIPLKPVGAKLSESEREQYLARLSEDHGVPAVDSVATGVGPIVDVLQQ